MPTFTYYEQLNGYEYLKQLDIGYFFYSGSYADDILAVLDASEKTIIHIPSVNSRESTKDKIKEVEHIIESMGEWQGTDNVTGFQLVKRRDGCVLRIADLVDDDPTKRDKVSAALKDSAQKNNRDHVDIIIALGMAKEGFDWIWCEHALTVGYRSSLTEIVQIIGRATRDAPGKFRARFTNLIAEPDASESAVTEAINDTLKAIAASLLMEQVLAPRFNFTPKNPQSGPVEGFDYGEGGYDAGRPNVGFNEQTGQFHIEIRGLIAGFEEIQRFAEVHGRAPQHGESHDIFERLYAVRLDRLRALEDCRSLLAPLDRQGLLAGAATASAAPVEKVDDDELLAELAGVEGAPDITELRHVRASADKRAAEEIANRTPCKDFETFKPLFAQVRKDLDAGTRQTRAFQTMAEIQKGEFFIVGGQIAYVAEAGEEFTTEYERRDSRLRVIYDNATESDVLLRSLQRALHRDEAGRRITDPVAGPLFAGESEDGDLASGTIYVLRSNSNNPAIEQHRDILHKIGVTGGDVKTRIANAKVDPTFLLADVEIVATYKLANINRTKLENLIHRIFDPARLDIEIKDRFGNPVIPREWFLVPIFVIDDAVEKIRDGTITGYVYDPKLAQLTKREGGGEDAAAHRR